jgi:putative drug exporter of the RND superfamily
VTPAAVEAEEREEQELSGRRLQGIAWIRIGRRMRVLEHYVGSRSSLANRVTRIDVVFRDDPFSRNSIARFERFRRAVEAELPEELHGSRLHYIGPTASIRDLKSVTAADQVRVVVLSVAAVFLALLALLRRPGLSGYIVLTVLFSYLATLGATFALFGVFDPGFAGLDWKVPVFLFAVLIAAGQAPHIYLTTRIDEERRSHGPLDGVTAALSKTGGVISGCGLVTAAAFASLTAASLVGMQQLGFALMLGVLLQTFVVRPLLVPAGLVLMHRDRFGAAVRQLEGETVQERPSTAPVPAAFAVPPPLASTSSRKGRNQEMSEKLTTEK